MARAGLDRQAVVGAAAALADAEGVEAVTLGALALRLGIRTPSLYNHVDGLPGLRRELALLGLRRLSDMLAEAALGRAGDEAVMAIAAAYRAFAREHPGLYAATLAQDPHDAEARRAGERPVEIVLAVLAFYRLEGDAAIHAVRGLRSALHGFVSLEAAGAFGIPLDLDESFSRLVRLLIGGLHREPAP